MQLSILRCTKDWLINTSGVQRVETVCMNCLVNTSDAYTPAWPRRWTGDIVTTHHMLPLLLCMH